MAHEHWKSEPEEHDFPSTVAYLSLLADSSETSALVDALRGASTETRKAKDLLRASALSLLPDDNEHVVADLTKVSKGEQLSPVLLVRGDLRDRRALVVADGYHRICASYHIDENADIPCRIVDLQ